MFASGLIGCGESSGVETASFRCNITNYYFYFRFVAFVNSHILAGSGTTAGNDRWNNRRERPLERPLERQKREATYVRPKKRDCADLHRAPSHTPADGLLEVVKFAAEAASESRHRQARTHPALRYRR